MNAVAQPTIAEMLEGGYYAGRILIAGAQYALLVAPKAEGQHEDTVWNRAYKDLPKAASWNDGLANTQAMAEGGSKLAQWALDLRISGFADWYLPSVDELEILYRALKPGTDENSQWGRSGINVSADPPSYPYALDVPKQTEIEAFRTGGVEAFDEAPYWSSTQRASNSYYAWGQYFSYGSQNYWDKDDKLRARAVRRLAI